MILKIDKENTGSVLECIKAIANGISAGQIEEIVLSSPEEKVVVENSQGTISSREIADFFHTQHASIFKKIAGYVCGYAADKDKKEFKLSSFTIPQGQSYPMYELTKKACDLFLSHVQTWRNYKKIEIGVERMRRAMKEKFGPKENVPEKTGSFLLEGQPRINYQAICRMFQDFITGPGAEGREISELTQKYEKFYNVMKGTGTSTKENQEIEEAVFDVAIEAEMQGFIYGFRMFDAMLSKSLVVAN